MFQALGVLARHGQNTGDLKVRPGQNLLRLLVAGVAGTPLTVVRPDGASTLAEFPRMISPAQPVVDIAGLGYSVQGVNVTITFSGEIFEMEDQRNWTDASYKTYVRPLSLRGNLPPM